VIHCGLSILSNLENFSCARWTAVVDDFSRLLFSFIQFFFIFKHSNVCIYIELYKEITEKEKLVFHLANHSST
jgi:hypothetical protein